MNVHFLYFDDEECAFNDELQDSTISAASSSITAPMKTGDKQSLISNLVKLRYDIQ